MGSFPSPLFPLVGGSPVTRPPAGVHTPVWAFTAVLEVNGKEPVNPQWLRGELSGLILGLTFQGDLSWKGGLVQLTTVSQIPQQRV